MTHLVEADVLSEPTEAEPAPDDQTWFPSSAIGASQRSSMTVWNSFANQPSCFGE